jgi:hypothetical protein
MEIQRSIDSAEPPLLFDYHRRESEVVVIVGIAFPPFLSPVLRQNFFPPFSPKFQF